MAAQRLFQGKYKIVQMSDGTIFAVGKSGKPIKADSVEELLEYLENLSTTETEGSEGDEEASHLTRRTVAEEEEVAEDENETPARTTKAPSRKSVSIPDKWIGAGTGITITGTGAHGMSSELKTWLNNNVKAGKSAADIVSVLINRYSLGEFNYDLSKVDRTKLADQLIAANPSCFGPDKKIKQDFDIKNFTFPGESYFKANYDVYKCNKLIKKKILTFCTI